MKSGTDQRRLSIAIITRNAAEELAETLESVRALADEIIVADTGSTDETREVAMGFHARVYAAPWHDDFSAVRNYAAQFCAGDFILWLDAGVRLSADAARDLREFVNTAAEPNTAYMFVVRVPAQAGEIAGEQVGMIRLVPNDPAIKFTGRVQESLAPALASLGIALEGLPHRIDRGLRELDPERKSRRARRNIQLAEIELRERGPQPALLNCLGDAFHVLGQNERAAQFYVQAIGLADAGSSEMLAGYYGLIVALDGSDQGRAGQLSTCLAALEVFPLDAQLLCAAGGYLQSLGRGAMALKAYETAHHFGRVNPAVWHLSGIIEVATSCLASALQNSGRLAEAQQTLEQSVRDYPDCQRLRRQLLALYVRQGKRKLALAQVEELPPETPYREALKSAVRGACLAMSQNWIPARAYLEAAYRGGSRDAICLEWLTRTLLAEKDFTAALPVLAQWRGVDSQNPELAVALATLASNAEATLPAGVNLRAVPPPVINPPLAIAATPVSNALVR